MSRRIVRVGQVLGLVALLVPAATSVHAADMSSPSASGSPSVPLSSTAPGSVVPHDAPRLEALLPVVVDGAPLFRTSYGPPSWAGLDPAGLGAIGELSREFGVELDAITMAFANDPTADPVFNLFAVAVEGVPGATVDQVYAKLAQQVEKGSTLSPAVLGGIAVTHLDAPNNLIPHVWTWSVDDVMLGIQASDEATAAHLIALLPTSAPAPAASASAAP